MSDNCTIDQSTFGNDVRILQGDGIAYVGGNVNVIHNYDLPPPEDTSKRDEKNDILRRLYTVPYADRKDRNPPRVLGTCEWFTSHKLFKDWEESKSSRLLWVSADPGCGKSVLVKYLVDSVLQTTESRTVCYFFFKDDFPDQRKVVNALRCILRQLFMKKPILLSDEVIRQFATGGETFFDSFTEIWKTLVQVSKDPNAGEIICILDAIDECESQGSQLARELCKLYGATNDFQLKFLLTSRLYGNIHRGFRPLEIPGLPIIHLSGENKDEIRKISQEIDIFIRSRVEDIGLQLRLINEEQDLLLQGLMQIPNRTYLWAHLTLDLIMKDLRIDKTRIAKTVSCIPKEVNEAYEKILSKSDNVEQAKKILRIVVAAARPLTLEEMNLALALQKNHRSNKNINFEHEERFRQELRDVCGLFITIFDSKIYLLHQTAKEFLLDDSPNSPLNVCKRSTWKHSLNMLESHGILLDICIWYLCNLEFDINRNIGTETLPLRAQDMIFLDYAAKYWTNHFRELRTKIQKEKTGLVLKICDIKSELCQMWFRSYWTSTNTEYPQGFTSLMITSYFGLQTAVQYLLDNKAEINSEDSTYQRSALSWATRNGFHTTVELLIRGARFKKGFVTFPWREKAQVNQLDRYGRTPLSYAVWNGSSAMVELLLKAGALTHLKDELGGTPLSYAYINQNEQIINSIILQTKNKGDISNDINNLLFSAAEKGHEEVVELVLKTSRVSPDAENLKGETPLLCAVEKNHAAVIKVLLKKGANPNCRDENNRTPLLCAAANNDITLVKALLEKGADPNCKDNRCQTPLLCAALQGNVETMRILLQRGADPNGEDDHGQTPLLYAAKRGLTEAVEIILQKGADPNCKNYLSQTPLLYAAMNGKVEVIEALLKGGADPNCKNRAGQTPLIYATMYDYVEVIEALLKGGADPNCKNRVGQTPLIYAAITVDVEVTEALLKGGADPNCKNGIGQTPLLYATMNNSVKIFEALLQRGANLKFHCASGLAPFSYAIEHGDVAIVKALLKIGANIEFSAESGRTPLSYAAECGSAAILKMLLERGADPNEEDISYQPPLMLASRNGHEMAVRELLRKGADPNYRNTHFSTPLSYAIEHGHKVVERLLIEAGANPRALFSHTTEKNGEVAVRSWIKERVNIKPLLLGAMEGH